MLYSEQRCGKEGRVSKTRRERESRGGTLQGSRETTFSSDSSDWCRIKIVKIIFFVAFGWSTEKQEIDARGWWVAGGGREWTKAGGGQNIITINIVFSGAGRKRTSRRESERGLMKYISEMVSPLHQGILQARTRYLSLISFIFRLWLWRRAGWKKQRDRERQCEGGRAQEKGKCI